MKKRIALVVSVICSLLVVIVFFMSILVVKSNNLEQAKVNAMSVCRTVANLYDGNNQIIQSFDDDYRITVIDALGVVLADSEYDNIAGMENHIDRDEIIAALNNSSATFVRESATTGKKMIYCAVKKESDIFSNGYVFIRISLEEKSIDTYIVKAIVPMLGILIASIIVAIICSILIASKLTKPLVQVKNGLNDLKDGNFKGFGNQSSDEEFQALFVDINDIAEKLEKSIYDAKSERDRLNIIVESINDGLVVFENGNISYINNSAKTYFKCTDEVIGKSVAALSLNAKIGEALEAARNGEISTFEIEENSRILNASFKSVSDNRFELAVFSDMTAERNSEKMRSEFFANASHELKTPLTAIIGFNDLVVQEDSEKKLEKYTLPIKSNATRMANVVDDMLKLSQLETKQETEKEVVNLRKIAESVVNDLEVVSSSKKVKVELNGEAKLKATTDKMYDLIKNLVENAIKYNEENGFVNIKLSDESKTVKLIVEDGGIGIDEKDSRRVFERFYRVAKSRSRATGGTGLGLSIVKHIVLLYNGEISLKSKLGIGTTVTVVLPKK